MYIWIGLCIGIFVALFGLIWTVLERNPQNNKRSEHSNNPIPTDIRANKKEGEEYDTIGDVLRKGGPRKVIIVITIVVLCAYLVIKVGWVIF
jgi:hypothetical protein